jgi:hypothetical protein
MDKKNKQRLEQLVRQGIVPSSKLPTLMQAMSNLHMGKQLMPKERDVLAKYMFNMTDIMLKDTTVFNRAKLHTQKTRYQTEETEVDSIDEKMIGGVAVVDGPEDEERMRHAAQTKAKRLSIKKRDKFRLLSPEVKKEKMKAGVEEQVLKMNEDYKAKFEAALKKFGVSNIRDLPADKKKEFFNHVDASHVAKNEEVELSNEETEQLDEYGNPAATPDRLAMIRKAADRVQSGQSGKDAQKRAKADMKQKGAQSGMAPTKKDVTEQVAVIRKTIKEGSAKEKIEAYKELNQMIEQFKTTGEL